MFLWSICIARRCGGMLRPLPEDFIPMYVAEEILAVLRRTPNIRIIILVIWGISSFLPV